MTTREMDLAIVGAGPAGISAAIEAVKLGAKVTLIDENVKPGGQIYQQLPDAFVIRDINQLGKDICRKKPAFLPKKSRAKKSQNLYFNHYSDNFLFSINFKISDTLRIF